MPTDLELEGGIRCTTSFIDWEGVKQVHEHSLLRYTQAKGGLLEVPMDRFWHADLHNVTVTSATAQIHIPFLKYQNGAYSEKENLNIFRFDEILMAARTVSPASIHVERAEFDVARLGNYIGHFPIDRQKDEKGDDQLNCTRQELHHVELSESESKTWIDGGFDLDGVTGGAFEIKPRHRVVLDFGESVTQEHLRKNVKHLSTFWEFMLHRPIHPGQVIYKSKHHGDFILHKFKESTDDGTPKAWFQTGLLQMPWNECVPHLSSLVQRWMRLDYSSAWMDNLMRLIHFRDLPTDVRFFMAYSALQGFAMELGLTGTLAPRGGYEEDRLWNDFKSYWGHLLFTIKDGARSYTDRIVRTRHHFAHLSRTNEDILRKDEEFSIAFFRLMVILKIMFMDKAGVEYKDWRRTLEQWALRIEAIQIPGVSGLVLGPV